MSFFMRGWQKCWWMRIVRSLPLWECTFFVCSDSSDRIWRDNDSHGETNCCRRPLHLQVLEFLVSKILSSSTFSHFYFTYPSTSRWCCLYLWNLSYCIMKHGLKCNRHASSLAFLLHFSTTCHSPLAFSSVVAKNPEHLSHFGGFPINVLFR